MTQRHKSQSLLLARLCPLGCARSSTPPVAGQATIEFTFAMVLVVLLIVGMIKVFLWTGNDLGNRWQKVHEQGLIDRMFVHPNIAPLPINAAVRSNIFGNQ